MKNTPVTSRIDPGSRYLKKCFAAATAHYDAADRIMISTARVVIRACPRPAGSPRTWSKELREDYRLERMVVKAAKKMIADLTALIRARHTYRRPRA